MNEKENELKKDLLDEELLDETGESPQEEVNAVAGSDFLDRLFGNLPKGMNAMKGGSPLIKPREVSFLFDGSEGAPDFFTDTPGIPGGTYVDVELTVRGLSSAEEIEALSEIGTAINAAPYALAKRALYAVSGRPIRPEERDLIWEGLCSGGRQMVLMAFQNLGGGASEAAMGKYRSSFSIS